jgi:hypothetical protein
VVPSPTLEGPTLQQALAAGERPPAAILIGVGDPDLLNDIASTLPETNLLALEPTLAAAQRLVAQPRVAALRQSGRLVVLAGPDYAGATEAWKLFKASTGMPPTFVHPAFERQAGEVTRARLIAAKIVLGARQNENARKRFAGPYLLNTLTNLPVIARESNAATLFDAFPGVPAVVVGAGPSLDRNLDDLRAIADRALIIAVDTATRPLLAAGIRPHLIVSVDPSDVNGRHLNDLADASDMWLVAEGSLHPTVFPQFTGRTFTFKVSRHHPWPWLATQQADRGTLQAWGSVLTTAFDLACNAGCNPVVFAGADLAYTGRLLYCRHTIYEPDWSHLTTDAARAEFFDRAYFESHTTSLEADVHGQDVLCAPRFVQFRDWLVARANAACDREILNATGGGILHGGRIVQSTLKESLGHQSVSDHGLADRLASAWHQGVVPSLGISLRRKLDHVLQRRDDEQQLAHWAAFAKDTVSVAQIAERGVFALRALEGSHRGDITGWKERLSDLMQSVELRRQLDLVLHERDEARTQRDQALAERDSAIRVRVVVEQERDAALAAVAAIPFTGHYLKWRTGRLRVLMDSWGHVDLRGARVLEMACGHGDVGGFFLSLGAHVTFTDAREEHLAVVRERYPSAVTVQHDANLPIPMPEGGRYDYVIHMGLLYHLRRDRIAASIANACELGRHVVLETEVCDSDDPTLIVEMNEAGPDQAFDGHGCRPTSACVERILDDLKVRWTRHDDPRLSTDFHVYDWKPLNNGRYFDPDAARANPAAQQQVLRRFYTIETE